MKNDSLHKLKNLIETGAAADFYDIPYGLESSPVDDLHVIESWTPDNRISAYREAFNQRVADEEILSAARSAAVNASVLTAQKLYREVEDLHLKGDELPLGQNGRLLQRIVRIVPAIKQNLEASGKEQAAVDLEPFSDRQAKEIIERLDAVQNKCERALLVQEAREEYRQFKRRSADDHDYKVPEGIAHIKNILAQAGVELPILQDGASKDDIEQVFTNANNNYRDHHLAVAKSNYGKLGENPDDIGFPTCGIVAERYKATIDGALRRIDADYTALDSEDAATKLVEQCIKFATAQARFNLSELRKPKLAFHSADDMKTDIEKAVAFLGEIAADRNFDYTILSPRGTHTDQQMRDIVSEHHRRHAIAALNELYIQINQDEHLKQASHRQQETYDSILGQISRILSSIDKGLDVLDEQKGKEGVSRHLQDKNPAVIALRKAYGEAAQLLDEQANYKPKRDDTNPPPTLAPIITLRDKVKEIRQGLSKSGFSYDVLDKDHTQTDEQVKEVLREKVIAAAKNIFNLGITEGHNFDPTAATLMFREFLEPVGADLSVLSPTSPPQTDAQVAEQIFNLSRDVINIRSAYQKLKSIDLTTIAAQHDKDIGSTVLRLIYTVAEAPSEYRLDYSRAKKLILPLATADATGQESNEQVRATLMHKLHEVFATCERFDLDPSYRACGVLGLNFPVGMSRKESFPIRQVTMAEAQQSYDDVINGKAYDVLAELRKMHVATFALEDGVAQLAGPDSGETRQSVLEKLREKALPALKRECDQLINNSNAYESGSRAHYYPVGNTTIGRQVLRIQDTINFLEIPGDIYRSPRVTKGSNPLKPDDYDELAAGLEKMKEHARSIEITTKHLSEGIRARY